MKQKLTLGILIVCAILVAITRTTATSQGGGTTSAAPPVTATLKGDGCLRAGVEAGCLILTTTNKKEKYSLHFDPKNKPDAETAIHFEGIKMDVDTCMQGTPVKVTKWYALKMKCPAEPK